MMKLTPDHYDKGILHPRMRALLNGDFYNVGWWDAAAGDDPNLACTRLVERMLACDDDKAAVTAIADVGCGLGAGASVIAAAYPGASLVGVNYSQKQVDYAQDRYGTPGVSFICADAVDLPFPDHSLDRMYCVEAAMHFQTRRGFFDQAFRVLRPGGRLILTDVLGRHANSVLPEANVIQDAAAYRRAVRDAGLDPVSIQDVTHQTLMPFKAYLRGAGLAPIARFFADMCDAYILVEVLKPAQ